MLEKCVLTIPELKANQRLGHKKTKLNICHRMLMSSTRLENRSFHVVERTRTSTKCQKMKNARAKRAKILFFNVKYANLWVFCCRRRRGCLSSLIMTQKDNEIFPLLTCAGSRLDRHFLSLAFRACCYFFSSFHFFPLILCFITGIRNFSSSFHSFL